MRTIFNRDTFLKFYNKLFEVICFLVVRFNSAILLIIMSSPGQKQGSCGHVMALFDNHKKCARCREKGVGDDPCVKKQDCQILRRSRLPRSSNCMATPTYEARKQRVQQKKI